MKLHYLPISDGYIKKIRETRRDAYNHDVETSIAGETGYGPCRCCLKQFIPGEKRLLFSFAPLSSDNPYNEIGPVYIHEKCTPYDQVNNFPPEVKKGRIPFHLVLRCYNKEKRMIYAHYVKDNNSVEDEISHLFQKPGVELIHIRNSTYQCFIAEVRRNHGTGS
jgi:hypothetical protein